MNYVTAPCVVPKVQQGRILVAVNESDSNNTVSMKQTIVEVSVVKHGTRVSVECEDRYEPSNSTSPVSCNNGTWSYIPKCQPGNQILLHLSYEMRLYFQ